MAKIPKQALEAFREWGKKGGSKRAKNLSLSERSTISKRAAMARWGVRKSEKVSMPSTRLNDPCWEDPVYLEEVLAYGALSEWRHLRRIIADHPFDKTAASLKTLLDSTKIYGITPLWKEILKNLQGGDL